MKILVDVPEKLTSFWREHPSLGMKAIRDHLKCSEKMARFYAKALKKGELVQTEAVKVRPAPGERKTALILPDIHAPYHDQRALDIAINYGVSRKIDLVMIGGDGVDCYAISSWRTDPQRPIFVKEVEMTVPIFARIAAAFPDSELLYLEGNHEARLRNLLWSGAKQLAGLKSLTIPSIYELSASGWKYVSNSDLMQNDLPPFRLGKLFILHGHEVRLSWGAVNFARLYYLKTHCNILAFHHHQTHEWIAAKLDTTIEGSWTGGCLCKLHPEYSPSTMWNHGFVVVHWDSDGDFSVQNKKIIGNKVL